MPNMYSPLPLFDTANNIAESRQPSFPNTAVFYERDYHNAISFLKSYNGSEATFNAYRRELERLLHWSWKIAQKSVADLRRADMAPTT